MREIDTYIGGDQAEGPSTTADDQPAGPSNPVRKIEGEETEDDSSDSNDDDDANAYAAVNACFERVSSRLVLRSSGPPSESSQGKGKK